MAAKDAFSGEGNLISLLSQLPRKDRWVDIEDLYRWEGYWYPEFLIKGIVSARKHFQARDDDIILASSMKVGTTWLRALLPCIMKETCREVAGNGDVHVVDPLTNARPNDLVPNLELQVYGEVKFPDISTIPAPRLFNTHIPYRSLPESIKNSNCKVVYIVRNPKDSFVSYWHFMNHTRGKAEHGPIPFHEAFEDFCNGVHDYGPFLDHALEYWKQSLERPEKILFLTYEEMKKNSKGQVKRLASFLGRSFANDEEVEKVLELCSIDRVKNMEVNKNGIFTGKLPNNAFFRKGIVGDWKNSFTSEMKERIDEVTRMKLEGSGLDLDM